MFENLFDVLTNNTLSRAELSFDGKIKNIHYGDILTKYGNILDMNEECVPYININSTVKYNESYLKDGDIIIADTAEDITVGKTTEIYNLKYNLALSGLHTIPCRPKIKFEPKYLGYYMNGPQYHKQLFPLMQGIKVLSISKSNITKTIIRYPSIDVQKKQTHILSLLDKKIRKQNELINCLKSYKRGLLARLFPKKGDTVPELRFKEFTADWERRKLSDICERVTRKNKNSESDLPLTISSQYGLIDQRDFFNKVVAAKDMSNYYLLQNGEYAYNKSYSNGYDYGSIKRLNAYEQGCLSTLYICFSLESSDVDSDYLECFFDTLQWYGDVSMICAEGARNHGLLNVDTKAFFTDVRINMPINIEEQRQISQYSNTLDTLIALHQEKCEMYAKIKNVLFKKMFI